MDVLITVSRFKELEFSVGEPKTIFHDPRAWGSPLFKCADGSLIYASFRSSDGGETWQEGQVGREPCMSMVQLSDGTVLGVSDTKAGHGGVAAGEEPGQFIGTAWKSKDNWRTVDGPIEVQMHIPDAAGGYDDGDKNYCSGPFFWRSILELENGGLLTRKGRASSNPIPGAKLKYSRRK